MDVKAVHDALLVFALLVVGVACTLVVLLYRRMKKEARQTTQYPFANTTEIALLFQTMRDLVREQKAIARDFNRSLDAKVEVVREAVRQVIAGHEHLTRMQNALRASLEKSGVVLEDSDFGEDPFSPFHAIAMPEESDLLDDAPPPDADEAEEPAAGEQPESPEPAIDHEAIGALLNLDETPQPQADANEDAVRQPPANGTATVRKTVFRYHDAGMNVAEIANELGLGKGEIRLMLNLREEERSG